MDAGIYVAFLAACLVPATALAQAEQVITPPQNLVLSNYNSAPVGPYGGLEGSAYAARVDDPSAAWFNPAGLARQAAPQIGGSAGVYQRTLVVPESLPNQGGSIQQLPNFVGFTFSPKSGLTVGAALLTTNAWNQETDSELFTTVPAGQQRFAYSADSDFEQRVLAIGAGYHGAGPWRFGGGFAFSLVDLRFVQSASDRLASPSDLQSVLVAARASGSAIQLRGQGGAQYDRSHWRFGAAFRTPGLTLHRSGVLTFDGVLDVSQSSGASLFDPNAQFEFHLPWEFQGGAAVVTPRFEIEVDLQAYTPISAYSMLSTSNPVLVYSETGANSAPSVTSHPFAGLTSESRGVANVGAGGHVRLFERRNMLLHASVGSNQSPTGAADTVFTKVDVATWTLGLSGALGKFQFAAGLNHQSGSSAEVPLRNLLDGSVIQSRIDIHLTGFIYSLAYQF